MEQNEVREQSTNQPDNANNSLTIAPPPASSTGVTLSTQGDGTCASCGSTADRNNNGFGMPSFVYAIGDIVPRFTSLAVEKEFRQSPNQAGTAGLTDTQAFRSILSERRNRYLARQLCWVLTIEGLETYILMPRDPVDYDLLIEALRPVPGPVDRDVVIGIRGPIASAEMCGGLMLPIVAFDQIYSFDTDALIGSIPKPPKVTAKDFAPRAKELFDRLVQVADNAGATDEHRALNYLATRYPDIYARTSDALEQNFMLAEVSVQPSRLSGARKIVTVVFTYNQRGGGTAGFYREQWFVRVDVTEEFPFLVSPLQMGFER